MNLLLRMQKSIELRQIGRRHDDLRRRRQGRVRLRERDDRHGGQWHRCREQNPQRIVNSDFAVLGCML
jgi:hypothetical protein